MRAAILKLAGEALQRHAPAMRHIRQGKAKSDRIELLAAGTISNEADPNGYFVAPTLLNLVPGTRTSQAQFW